LHTAENLSRIFSNVATIAVIGYLLFFIILFISLAAGYFIGSMMDSNELGFLCVAGFYAMLLILKSKLIETKIQIDILQTKEVFSISALVLSLARKYIPREIFGIAEAIFNKY
jgi:hypothetical protein